MWLSLGRLLSATSTPSGHPLESDTMLHYFLAQLEVRTKLIEPSVDGDGRKQQLFQEACARLATFAADHGRSHDHLVDEAWNDAYRIERLLALVEPSATLMDEVKRRLDEASDEKVVAAGRFRDAFIALQPLVVDDAKRLKPEGEPQLRSLLLAILEEMHWTFQRKFHSRPIRKAVTRRLVWTGLTACSLFVLPYVYIYFEQWLGDEKYVLPLQGWSWLPLWTAVTAGFFGAMFSRLLSLQASWNSLSLGELKDARDFSSIFLRGAVGMTGAVVVYYFLLSGVIGGGLFPQFKELGLHQLEFKDTTSIAGTVPLRLILPNPQLALLVVWSFLAGFSERLVPGILQTTEASLGDSSAQPRKAS